MNEEVEKELKELAQEEERHFKKEQGFFARLFGKKPKEPTQEEIDALAASNVKAEEEQPTLPEDVKEAIRTLHRWLEKLPAKRLEEFKASEDFQQYKEVLTKYGLVKKREEQREME